MNRWVLFAACSLLLPVGLSGTTLLPVDLGGLADQAELVFTGKAIASESRASKDGSTAFTFVTFAVDEVLKGAVASRELTLRFDGGDLGGRFLVVEGMPRFDEGESYLLFVHGNGRSASPVVGWWQGQYRFSEDKQLGRRLLLDAQGAPLRGIRGDRWLRGLPAREGGAVRQRDLEGDEAVVLGEEGVRVTVPEEALAQKAAALDADLLVRHLRGFLRERAHNKAFAPGRVVESALPERAAVPAIGVTAPSMDHP